MDESDTKIKEEVEDDKDEVDDKEEVDDEKEILIKQPWTKTWGRYFLPCRFGQSERLI